MSRWCPSRSLRHLNPPFPKPRLRKRRPRARRRLASLLLRFRGGAFWHPGSKGGRGCGGCSEFTGLLLRHLAFLYRKKKQILWAARGEVSVPGTIIFLRSINIIRVPVEIGWQPVFPLNLDASPDGLS